MTEQPEPILLGLRRGDGVVTIILSGGETLELAPDALPDDLPAAGAPVPAALLACLRDAAARKKIARRVFALLDRRAWTVARLRARLAEDGHETAAVEAVLARFVAEGLLCDRLFAEAFCRDALRRRPVGSLWLRARLDAQGVAAAEAVAAIRQVLPLERERTLAREAAAERWRRLGPAAGRSGAARVARFLAARGFPAALARAAALGAAPKSDAETAARDLDDVSTDGEDGA